MQVFSVSYHKASTTLAKPVILPTFQSGSTTDQDPLAFAVGQSNNCNSFIIVSPVSVILLDMYVFHLDCSWCLYQDHLLYMYAVNEINHY